MKYNIVTYLIFCSLITLNCMQRTVLEFKDVQQFKVNAVSMSNPIKLRISGLAFHSSLAVNNINLLERDQEVQMIVYLSVTKKGLSGSFDCLLTLNDNINKVTFGKAKHIIWKRNS